MDMLQVFINKCLQKIVNIIWREINTNYNLWNTNWRAGDDESENERAKHCPLSFYTSQQRRYNGLACRADYSIFTRQWTCPPMGKSMLTNGLAHLWSVCWPTAIVAELRMSQCCHQTDIMTVYKIYIYGSGAVLQNTLWWCWWLLSLNLKLIVT